MKRILLAGMKHETNTFATGSTGMREYEDRTLLLGDEAAAYFAGTKTEYGGMLDAAAEAVVQKHYLQVARNIKHPAVIIK